MKAARLLCLALLLVLLPSVSMANVNFDDMTNAQLIAMDDALAEEMIARGLYAYISPSGSKYHAVPTCSNMKVTMRVPVDDLEACGYEPCKRCYKGGKTE